MRIGNRQTQLSLDHERMSPFFAAAPANRTPEAFAPFPGV